MRTKAQAKVSWQILYFYLSIKIYTYYVLATLICQCVIQLKYKSDKLLKNKITRNFHLLLHNSQVKWDVGGPVSSIHSFIAYEWDDRINV